MLDDSMLSSSSDNPLTNSAYTYKSQGLKQLTDQKSQADALIEQSRKRIKDITELMKPPAEVMRKYTQEKSMKVMEEELKSLSSKIQDLESKLCITS